MNFFPTIRPTLRGRTVLKMTCFVFLVQKVDIKFVRSYHVHFQDHHFIFGYNWSRFTCFNDQKHFNFLILYPCFLLFQLLSP